METKDELLNRLSLERYHLYFNQLYTVNQRAYILDKAVNELHSKLSYIRSKL